MLAIFMQFSLAASAAMPISKSANRLCNYVGDF